MNDTYKEYVEELIKNNNTKLIACSSNDCYKDAIECIFNNALFEVSWLIHDESLMENIINRNICDSIIKFLNSGRTFNLYINKRYPDGRFGQFRASLIGNYNNFNYKKISNIITKNNNAVIEYIVFDKQGYRIKPNVNKIEALFCANDPAYAKSLLNVL